MKCRGSVFLISKMRAVIPTSQLSVRNEHSNMLEQMWTLPATHVTRHSYPQANGKGYFLHHSLKIPKKLHQGDIWGTRGGKAERTSQRPQLHISAFSPCPVLRTSHVTLLSLAFLTCRMFV
jgi:hypothetical protein